MEVSGATREASISYVGRAASCQRREGPGAASPAADPGGFFGVRK